MIYGPASFHSQDAGKVSQQKQTVVWFVCFVWFFG